MKKILAVLIVLMSVFVSCKKEKKVEAPFVPHLSSSVLDTVNYFKKTNPEIQFSEIQFLYSNAADLSTIMKAIYNANGKTYIIDGVGLTEEDNDVLTIDVPVTNIEKIDAMMQTMIEQKYIDESSKPILFIIRESQIYVYDENYALIPPSPFYM
jgi:hypothetical protein